MHLQNRKELMHLEGKYLLLSYRDIPDTEFICERCGDLRIRVSFVEPSELPIESDSLEELGGQKVLVFENVSNKSVEEQGQYIAAIKWYKSKLGLKIMSLIYL